MARRGVVLDEEDKKYKLNKSGIGKLMNIFVYVLPYKWLFIVGMIFMFLSSLTALSFPYLIGLLVDSSSESSNMNFLNKFIDIPKPSLQQVIIALVVTLILQGIFSYLRVIFLAIVSENTMGDIRRALYDRMISLPITFFEKNRVGALTSRITADVTQLQDTLYFTMAEFFRQILTLIIGITIIFTLSSKLSLIMLATFPLLIIAAVTFGRYIRRLSKKTQESLAEANVVAEETLHNIQVVKSFTNENLESERYDGSIRKTVKFAIKSSYYRGAFVSFFIYAIFGGIILVLWQGMQMVNAGTMDIGELVAFVIFMIYIGASVGGMGDLMTRLQKAVGASDRVREILGETPELTVDQSARDLGRISGDIKYADVNFSYPSREDITVLNGLDIHIKEGERVALVGSSGAGKSTIAQLLMRFYHLDAGSISVDGKDIKDIDISHLRQNIGIVPQEVILFGGTIAENISYGKPNASKEEIKQAAVRANAWEFISGFPEQLETVVGDRGIKLSGGQRQRVAIARAILKDPSILILDEATSSLDSESEMLVQQALNELMKGRTSIVIAHRLSTIRDVDNIFVLEKGKVVESGTHDELTANQNSIYLKFLELQTQENTLVS